MLPIDSYRTVFDSRSIYSLLRSVYPSSVVAQSRISFEIKFWSARELFTFILTNLRLFILQVLIILDTEDIISILPTEKWYQ